MTLLPNVKDYLRHPERSRFSGEAKDLPHPRRQRKGRSLRPLEKTRAFGMTPPLMMKHSLTIFPTAR